MYTPLGSGTESRILIANQKETGAEAPVFA